MRQNTLSVSMRRIPNWGECSIRWRGRATVQRDIDRLEKWLERHFMKFIKTKYRLASGVE